jgi:hypothetical protein
MPVMPYIGRIRPCFTVVVFQYKELLLVGEVAGWTGGAKDFGLGRPIFRLVVLPLNALIFSVSLAQGAAAAEKVWEFKDIL